MYKSGKDGVPYPVARKTYDKSISYLSSAIEGVEIEREERIRSLKKWQNIQIECSVTVTQGFSKESKVICSVFQRGLFENYCQDERMHLYHILVCKLQDKALQEKVYPKGAVLNCKILQVILYIFLDHNQSFRLLAQ